MFLNYDNFLNVEKFLKIELKPYILFNNQNAKLNHLDNFLLGIGGVFDKALGGGKGGVSGKQTDIGIGYAD